MLTLLARRVISRMRRLNRSRAFGAMMRLWQQTEAIIGKPDQSYMDLLLVDRGITALWFGDESCKALNGDGTAWCPLAPALQKSSMPVAAAG
jgi:hypothetical protein